MLDRIALRAASNALQRDGTKCQVAQLSFGQAGAPVSGRAAVIPPGLLMSTSTINQAFPAATASRPASKSNGLRHAPLGVGGIQPPAGRGILMQRNVNVPTLTVAQANALGVPISAGRTQLRQHQSIRCAR
jgi:hypothetical protein